MGMGNGDAPGFLGVLEVNVASLLGDLFPSIGPQSRKNVPTVHDRRSYSAHEYT